MLKLIGLIAVIWVGFYFGIAQMLARWTMVALSLVATV